MSRSTTEFFFEPNAESLFQRVCFSQRAFPGPALNLYVSETSSSPHRDWKNQGMERDKAAPPPPPWRAPHRFSSAILFSYLQQQMPKERRHRCLLEREDSRAPGRCLAWPSGDPRAGAVAGGSLRRTGPGGWPLASRRAAKPEQVFPSSPLLPSSSSPSSSPSRH